MSKMDASMTSRGSSRGFWLRLASLVLLLAAAALLLVVYGKPILSALADREARLKALADAHPIGAVVIAFVAYVGVTGLSLPGATALSVACGWLFGFWKGLLLVSFASTTGATIAFLLSRHLFGRALEERYAQQVAALNAGIQRDGAFYLFTLRMIPQVPFFVVNAAMGLTRMRTSTFWWVSQLGMLPATVVFVLAGSSVGSLREVQERGLSSLLDWKLGLALALLGILPLAARKVLALARPRAALTNR